MALNSAISSGIEEASFALSVRRRSTSGLSDDTVQRLMKRGEFRKVKQGAYTYALAREVRDYAERLADQDKRNHAA
ncbi:MAG: helix-turn-helix domain-containing protein [Asticcacaulis sp.]|nr:helix-turn-helix domain-containing protein [Asticcacaulis sp.]